jgi:hypothetical protein
MNSPPQNDLRDLGKLFFKLGVIGFDGLAAAVAAVFFRVNAAFLVVVGGIVGWLLA